MDYLYVCLFSNGLIKVGRSIDPISRVAVHADRVSCVGVHLLEYRCFLCGDQTPKRELQLIDACASAATDRFLNEWFEGLDFQDVCRWAEAATAAVVPASPRHAGDFGYRLAAARKKAGLTQDEFGKGMRADGGDLQKATISHWETGTHLPNVEQLRLICVRLGITANDLIEA